MIKRLLKKSRYVFEYLGVLLLHNLVRFLPYSAVRALASIGGAVMYAIPPFRKLVSANLKVAFPEKEEKEIRRLTKSNLRHTAMLALEIFWFRKKGGKADEMVRFADGVFEEFDKSDAVGRGGMWIPPHLGNWELLGIRYKRARKPKFAVVARKMNNPYIDAFVNESRKSEGTSVIYAKGAVKEMMKALRDNFYVATLIDQNTKARDGGIFVDFFGLKVPASRAAAMFARKMNLPVVVACCVRENRGYTIRLTPLPKNAADYESDEEFTQAVMKEIEGFIRRYPDQYLWLYERWRHIPETLSDEERKRYPFYSETVSPRFYDNNAPKP